MRTDKSYMLKMYVSPQEFDDFGFLGRSWGCFWRRLGTSWERLEPSGGRRGHFGAILGRREAFLDRLGGLLELSWPVLELSWLQKSHAVHSKPAQAGPGRAGKSGVRALKKPSAKLQQQHRAAAAQL